MKLLHILVDYFLDGLPSGLEFNYHGDLNDVLKFMFYQDSVVKSGRKCLLIDIC